MTDPAARPLRPHARAVRPALAAAMLLALPALSALPSPALAGDLSFHAGIEIPAERLGAVFEKTVDTTDPATLVPEPRRGRLLQDEDSASAAAAGIGLLGGCRLALGGGGADVGAEVDLAFHGGAVESRLDGVGESAGRNQLGESWPDDWSFEPGRSYGLTLSLGGARGLYALGGVRRLEARLETGFHGCMDPTPCSTAADTPAFTTGTDGRDLELDGWTAGLGFEKGIREQVSLRLETRYTRYGDHEWTTLFEEVGVTVPAVLQAGGMGLSSNLAWHF